MKLRIMLVDDNLLYRQALKMLLDLQQDIEVVSELSDGDGVLHEMERTAPDVICMDIGMQSLSGPDATRRLLQQRPQARVIGLSAHVETAQIEGMFAAGAMGYVVKGGSVAELLCAIHCVSRGELYNAAKNGAQAGPLTGNGG